MAVCVIIGDSFDSITDRYYGVIDCGIFPSYYR